MLRNELLFRYSIYTFIILGAFVARSYEIRVRPRQER
jgi:hypothetical protein